MDSTREQRGPRLSPEELRLAAQEMRAIAITDIFAAGSGHPGGCLSIMDVAAALYLKILNHDPSSPDWPERDRVFWSAGHKAPALYVSLGRAGYFPLEDTVMLRQLGSGFEGHPNRLKLPGVEISSGSLGQGLSVAVGSALAAKRRGQSLRAFCIMGDGEQQEGSVWEAVMAAAHYQLDNLCAIVDQNRLQIDGWVQDVMNVDPLGRKYTAFGWNAIEIDGHNIDEILSAFAAASLHKGKSDGHYRSHSERQRRLVHGESGCLARCGSQSRAIRKSHHRAGDPGCSARAHRSHDFARRGECSIGNGGNAEPLAARWPRLLVEYRGNDESGNGLHADGVWTGTRGRRRGRSRLYHPGGYFRVHSNFRFRRKASGTPSARDQRRNRRAGHDGCGGRDGERRFYSCHRHLRRVCRGPRVGSASHHGLLQQSKCQDCRRSRWNLRGSGRRDAPIAGRHFADEHSSQYASGCAVRFGGGRKIDPALLAGNRWAGLFEVCAGSDAHRDEAGDAI